MSLKENPSLYIGFDEAGYGPLLGPLCSAACVIRTSPIGVVKDSKKIHRPKDVRPLLKWCKNFLGHDAFQEYLKKLGEVTQVQFSNEPWFNDKGYQSDLVKVQNPLKPPPLSGAKIYFNLFGVDSFNRKTELLQNKADVLLNLITEVLKPVLEDLPDSKGQQIDLAFDRLGGRKFYGGILKSWGFVVEEAQESQKSSVYWAKRGHLHFKISFLVGGDSLSPAIAAASCFAKLSRELLMLSFNRWWLEKIPDLKPTAGYVQDGKRFVKNIENYCFKHNISLNQLIRKR